MKLIKLSRLLELLIIAVSIFIISTILIYFLMPRVVDVHEITEHPEQFKGNIGVVGEAYRSITKNRTITKKSQLGSFLILDCGENSRCIAIPVSYKGVRPGIGSKIIAYGKIKEDKGNYRFIESFEAYKIKFKNDDLKGEMLYSIRKVLSKFSKEGIIEFRKWLYSICEKCPKLKKRLLPAPVFS